MSKVKPPTLKDKVRVYEELLHDIQFHAEISGRADALNGLIQKICSWSRAHGGDGLTAEKEKSDRINLEFWKLSKERK